MAISNREKEPDIHQEAVKLNAQLGVGWADTLDSQLAADAEVPSPDQPVLDRIFFKVMATVLGGGHHSDKTQ